MANAIKNYFVESFQELGKVTWPSRSKALNICIIVVTFVIISAAIIAGIDFVFNKGYSLLLSLAQR